MTLRFTLARPARARLEVVDLAGRAVMPDNFEATTATAPAYDDGGDYSTTVLNEAPDDEDDSTAQSVSPESPLAANVAADENDELSSV